MDSPVSVFKQIGGSEALGHFDTSRRPVQRLGHGHVLKTYRASLLHPQPLLYTLKQKEHNALCHICRAHAYGLKHGSGLTLSKCVYIHI